MVRWKGFLFLIFESVWFISECCFCQRHRGALFDILESEHIKTRALDENIYVYVGFCGLVGIGCLKFKTFGFREGSQGLF